MKFTFSWLKDHLETEASFDEICEALTDLGLEVEDVTDPTTTLGAFRICRVIEATQHPNADRLQLCQVETWPDGPDGKTEVVQVVCGAPNARTGLIGVFAPVGTHIPGTGLDLKRGRIRGVDSCGMLCSGRELMINDDHDGIIDLPDDAPMGVRYIDYADIADPVVEIAVTPNRPDSLGVRGIARDLAARGLGTLKPEQLGSIEGGFRSSIGVSIDDDLLERGCPVFLGRMITGIKNGPSPDWLQSRLRAVGLRPISAVVDVTNYLTHDRNRPLHAFDADLIEGDLRVHFAAGGDKITALDDKEYTLEPDMMAISDENGPQSIAGVIGGNATGCTESTTSVFLESALWDPVTIASTGRRLKIISDARYRFERGVDPEFTETGLDLATRLIIEICGGSASELVAAGQIPETSRSYVHDPDRVKSLVGMDISADEQTSILEALGFRVEGGRAHVPSWRPDIRGDADLVEEIARIKSLGQLQGVRLPRRDHGVGNPILTREQRRESVAKRTMAMCGYNECVTYSFIDRDMALRFGGSDEVRLANPIASDLSHMRPDLLPGLLKAASRNQARGFSDLALFEVGPVFFGSEPGDQETVVTGLLVGHTGPRDPYGDRRPVDVGDARADVDAVLAALGAPDRLMTERAGESWWHPGRAANLKLGPKIILATFGELHPTILKHAEVSGPAAAFVVHIASVPVPKSRATGRAAFKLDELQAVERDFAFVVDTDVEVDRILGAVRGADRSLVSEVSVFDEFVGKKAEEQVGAGKKSVAINVRLQPKDRTLTDEEIEAVSSRIVEKVAKVTGAVLRQ